MRVYTPRYVHPSGSLHMPWYVDGHLWDTREIICDTRSPRASVSVM